MMQVVILCGGTGTRLREQTEFTPKPMIPIGGMPLVVHIMKYYSHFGCDEFVLALGYKQEAFKQYFTHYRAINSDIEINMRLGTIDHNTHEDGWTVRLVDTGEDTLKGARLKRVEQYVAGDTFMMTYGDGLANVDLKALLEFHRSHGRIVTVTGIHQAPRFGEIHHENSRVVSFTEKPHDQRLVNGGYFVFNKQIFSYLTDREDCDLEHGALGLLAGAGEMMVFEHRGYWGCVDTLNELLTLQQLWREGKAPWKIW